MRTIILAAIVAAAPASAFAQTHAYVNGAGGFATTTDGTSGDVLGEAGVRVAPNLFVFGDVGRFHNLQPSAVQPAIDTTVQTLSAIGVDVTSTSSVPAWYTSGGVRYQIPTRARVTPYVFTSVGMARLTPRATRRHAAEHRRRRDITARLARRLHAAGGGQRADDFRRGRH